MKKLLSGIAIAASITMVACSSNPTALQNEKVNADTVGLAQFNAYKAQQEQAAMYALYAADQAKTEAANKAVRTSTARKSTTTRKGSVGSTTSYPAKPAEKKGWSKAAKGTAIGAAGGAVIGAVVNKRNRAVGAVIGGVAGGAVGYGIGRHMDKKDGRY